MVLWPLDTAIVDKCQNQCGIDNERLLHGQNHMSECSNVFATTCSGLRQLPFANKGNLQLAFVAQVTQVTPTTAP